jgi:hypothetical protein
VVFITKNAKKKPRVLICNASTGDCTQSIDGSNVHEVTLSFRAEWVLEKRIVYNNDNRAYESIGMYSLNTKSPQYTPLTHCTYSIQFDKQDSYCVTKNLGCYTVWSLENKKIKKLYKIRTKDKSRFALSHDMSFGALANVGEKLDVYSIKTGIKNSLSAISVPKFLSTPKNQLCFSSDNLELIFVEDINCYTKPQLYSWCIDEQARSKIIEECGVAHTLLLYLAFLSHEQKKPFSCADYPRWEPYVATFPNALKMRLGY